MTFRPRKYWLNTVSKSHVRLGQQGGFVQANHGKRTPLERLRAGDLMVFYSPKEVYGEKAPCQRFTALAEIAYAETYQVEVSADFQPFRRDALFLPMTEVSIQPLLDRLSFVPNRRYWGIPFRRGLFEISAEDFAAIAAAIGSAEAV